MTKRAQKPRPTTRSKPAKAPSTVEKAATADLAASIYREALEAILDEIQGIRTGKIVPQEHDAASRIAWLAAKATAVAAEQRKAEAAELAAAKKLTHHQVVLFLQQLAPEARAEVIAQATDTEQERRSVLG